MLESLKRNLRNKVAFHVEVREIRWQSHEWMRMIHGARTNNSLLYVVCCWFPSWIEIFQFEPAKTCRQQTNRKTFNFIQNLTPKLKLSGHLQNGEDFLNFVYLFFSCFPALQQNSWLKYSGEKWTIDWLDLLSSLWFGVACRVPMLVNLSTF